MNDNGEKQKTTDLKSWLRRSLEIKNASLDEVIANFKEILAIQGFKLQKENVTRERAAFEALYGSRFIAILMGFIPYIGRNLPAGKRFGLKASITDGKPIVLKMNIVPYMEVFDGSEVFILTQTVDEKASDEYVAARKMFAITQALQDCFDFEQKDARGEFDNKTYIRDSVLNLLIYPLDGYKSSKMIHFPDASGPKWCWPAFVIPEFWFIWHEIWGVSLLLIALEFYTVFKMVEFDVGAKVIGFTLITFHTLLGFMGNRFFFYRYGRWPKDLQVKKNSTVPN